MEKKYRKMDLVITAIFLGLLFLPGIAYWLIGDMMDKTNYENRALYEAPTLEISSLSEFPERFENYFNDNLPFKNEIRKVRSEVLYGVLGVSSSSRVTVGEDGWLFYNGTGLPAEEEDDDPIADYRKKDSFSEEKIEAVKTHLVEVEEALRKKGIKFYVYVIPNKENVYADLMPVTIRRSERELSRTEELIERLRQETDLQVIYPKEQLVKGRDKYETYLKYDTHWTDYGAFLGVKELLRTIDGDFEIPEVRVHHEESAGDLAVMDLLRSVSYAAPVVEGFNVEAEVSCTEEGEVKRCTNTGESNGKKLLFKGDSFRQASIKYLAAEYKRSTFMPWNMGGVMELVDELKPDVVVFEVVERRMVTLRGF